MNYTGKIFTKEEIREILGNKVDEHMYVWNVPQFKYHMLIRLEIYQTLMALGISENQLGKFIQANPNELLNGREIYKYSDYTLSCYIRIDLVSLRQNLDKKIAAWEMSKKPAEPEINAYEKACNEWLKGCGNSREMNPSDCYSCTAAFLEHVQKLSGRE